MFPDAVLKRLAQFESQYDPSNYVPGNGESAHQEEEVAEFLDRERDKLFNKILEIVTEVVHTYEPDMRYIPQGYDEYIYEELREDPRTHVYHDVVELVLGSLGQVGAAIKDREF